MKKEIKTIEITDRNGKTWTEEIGINPEFPHYAIKMRGIDAGHEFTNGPVGTERLADGTYEARAYTYYSEQAQLDGNGKKGEVLATIRVLA